MGRPNAPPTLQVPIVNEEATPPTAIPRLPGLDLLRAVAISWVMAFHASSFGLISRDHWIPKFGWMGVDLFFVLSGFLIAGQLLRPWAVGRRPDYSRFFVRRLLRTLPAYLVVVALYFSLPVLRDHPDLQPLWQFLTFTENFANVPNPAKAFSQAWSLCVEEQFYLVFPATVAVLALRPHLRVVVPVFIAILMVGIVSRGYFWLADVGLPRFDTTAIPHFGRYMTLIYYPTWARLDGLLAGVAAATVQTFRPVWWRALTARANLLAIAGGAGVVTSAVFFQDMFARFWPAVFGFPLLAGSMALLVVAGSDNRSLIGRYPVPGAGALAAGAYSLYLSHKMVFHAVQSYAPWWPQPFQAIALGVAILAALGVGALLYWLVERPFLKLRDRLHGRSSVASTEEPFPSTPLAMG
jgi:peptidoglycan/LPS O-acetylase OafA/YrhL